jgi:hypothetical protein
MDVVLEALGRKFATQRESVIHAIVLLDLGGIPDAGSVIF